MLDDLNNEASASIT